MNLERYRNWSKRSDRSYRLDTDWSYRLDSLSLSLSQDGLTPLHVAVHYDNQQVALLLLDKGASPQSAAKVRVTIFPILPKYYYTLKYIYTPTDI